MTRLRVGIASLERYKSRTMAIAIGKYRPAPEGPKEGFESFETMSQVLSGRHRALLAVIVNTQPQSIEE